MPEAKDEQRPLHENLDTAYVNLAALVAYLRGRGFTGRVHVELDEYEADVILRAGETAAARERDHATGRADEGAQVFERLLARAAEPGGLVSVYEGAHDDRDRDFSASAESKVSTGAGGDSQTSDDGRRELLELAGELVAAIERAVLVAGGDFGAALHAARLRLTEDYPFLDPFARRFEYAEGVVSLAGQAGERLFVHGVCEMLRGAVAHVATAEQKLGVRKDAARELSILLRRRRTRLERFKLTRQQLERVAGMKLL